MCGRQTCSNTHHGQHGKYMYYVTLGAYIRDAVCVRMCIWLCVCSCFFKDGTSHYWNCSVKLALNTLCLYFKRTSLLKPEQVLHCSAGRREQNRKLPHTHTCTHIKKSRRDSHTKRQPSAICVTHPPVWHGMCMHRHQMEKYQSPATATLAVFCTHDSARWSS